MSSYLLKDICYQIFPLSVWHLCLLHWIISFPSPLPHLHFQVPEFIHRNSYQSVTSVITASSSNHTFATNIFAKKAWCFKALGHPKLIAATTAGSARLHEAVVRVWLSAYPHHTSQVEAHLVCLKKPWGSSPSLSQRRKLLLEGIENCLSVDRFGLHKAYDFLP